MFGNYAAKVYFSTPLCSRVSPLLSDCRIGKRGCMVEPQPPDKARFRLKVISEFYGEPLMGGLRLSFKRSIIAANWLTIGW